MLKYLVFLLIIVCSPANTADRGSWKTLSIRSTHLRAVYHRDTCIAPCLNSSVSKSSVPILADVRLECIDWYGRRWPGECRVTYLLWLRSSDRFVFNQPKSDKWHWSSLTAPPNQSQEQDCPIDVEDCSEESLRQQSYAIKNHKGAKIDPLC